MFNFLQFSQTFFQFLCSNQDPDRVHIWQLGDRSPEPLVICMVLPTFLFHPPFLILFPSKELGPLKCIFLGRILLIVTLW